MYGLLKVEVLDTFGDKQQKIERISSGHHRSIPSASQNNTQNSFSRNQLHVPDPKYSKTLLEIDEADLQSRYVNILVFQTNVCIQINMAMEKFFKIDKHSP